MSATDSILDRWLVDVAAGITGTVRTHRGPMAVEQIPVASTPFAMVFAEDWSTEQDEGGHRVESQTLTWATLVYGSQVTKADVWTWLDELWVAIAADRTLNSLVEWCWIVDAEPREQPEVTDTDVADRMLLLTVAAQRLV